MSIRVVPVRTKAERESFLRLPWLLYKHDPAWVPNLLILQRDVISPKGNPFFEHAEVELFIAYRDGAVAGRISAQIDRHHNEQHGEKMGFFGFYESVDDDAVAAALLGAAEGWLRARGMERARGPLSFSINEEVGLLVEGFEHPPMVQMPHALPYYGGQIESSGYTKAMDLLAYRWEVAAAPERVAEAAAKTRAVPGLRLRKINRLRLRREVDLLLDIYNDAWHENWGYVAITPAEARKIASDLMLIADPRVAYIAEVNGEPAGMVVGLPNLYEAIRDFKGFIDPWKAVKLLWRLKIRGVKTGRVILFGVRRKFRTRELYGLPFVLLDEIYKGAKKGGYEWCEESWVLENNSRLNALMPRWNAHVYKRYRVYEKRL